MTRHYDLVRPRSTTPTPSLDWSPGVSVLRDVGGRQLVTSLHDTLVSQWGCRGTLPIQQENVYSFNSEWFYPEGLSEPPERSSGRSRWGAERSLREGPSVEGGRPRRDTTRVTDPGGRGVQKWVD